jgi:hypothetical protein
MQSVLLVAGFNYENLSNPIFLQCCNNRMAWLLAKSKRSVDMVFTLFDVGGGVIKQNKADPKTKKRSWTDLQTFTAVTTKNYSSFVTGTENRFDKNPEGIMSITDVYSFVQGVGAGAEKGTVIELSFFSHGWMGGPILVNSFDHASGDARDPNDKDARQWKDFKAPNMDATALAKFRAAFADNSIVWIWGCSFFRAAHLVLSQLFKTSKYRSTPPGKIQDTDTFTLDFSEDDPHPSQEDDFNTVVNSVLPGGRLSGRSYTITVTFSKIHDAFENQLTNSYSSKIANAIPAGGTVFGALPGTGSDYEANDKHIRLPLMRIPTRRPPYDNDFSRTLSFYRTYIGIALDPENRGYGTF